MDSTLLDVRINSPKCQFFRVARWFDFTNSITEKKFTEICRAAYKNELYTIFLYSGYLLSGRGVTRGGKPKGHNSPGAEWLREYHKVPTIPQVLYSVQYICFRNTSVSNLGAPNLLLARGATWPRYAPPLWNLLPDINCGVALIKVFLEPDFFAFRPV